MLIYRSVCVGPHSHVGKIVLRLLQNCVSLNSVGEGSDLEVPWNTLMAAHTTATSGLKTSCTVPLIKLKHLPLNSVCFAHEFKVAVGSSDS